MAPVDGTYSGLVLRELITSQIGQMTIKVTKADGLFYLSGNLQAFDQPSTAFTGEFVNKRYSDTIYNADGCIQYRLGERLGSMDERLLGAH